MSDPSILGQIALGYSPFIDRNRAVTATRLTVMPLRPDAVLDVAQLLHEVGNVWPASGGRVSLNVVSESLLQDLLGAQPSANLMVEIPSFMQVGTSGLLNLAEVVEAITVSVQRTFGRTIRFAVADEAVRRWMLPESESIPIALTINELLTNAVKHADQAPAPPGPAGRGRRRGLGPPAHR